MKREIKFRGERLSKANEWVYGDLLLTDCQDENGRCYTRCEIRSMLPLTGPVFYEVDPATIGQYTGLKDYNNVEIYEGDIVGISQDGMRERAVVKFKRGSFVLVSNKKIIDSIWGYDPDIFEVIGNIHDDPELLKGGNNGL